MTKEFDHLPPEERIEKLKELEEKKKKEIAEAKKKIAESKEEISDTRKWLDKVPIPQVGQDDLEGLSEEGKVIVKVNKGISEEKEEEEVKVVKKEESIDDFFSEGEIVRLEASHTEYKLGFSESQLNQVYKLSGEPVNALYKEMSSLSYDIEQKGYVSRKEEERVRMLSSALEKRLNEVYGGTMSEEVAAKSLLTKQMAGQMRNMYKGDAGKDKPQDMYHSDKGTNVYQSGFGGGSS